MSKNFQLINSNAGVFRGASLELRTTEMPSMICASLGYRFESCLFSTGDSEVVGRYDNLSDAAQGHFNLSRKYNLGTKVK